MTIHRALGYVDRASVREGSPLRVVMCSEGRKGDGIDLRMSGAQMERFRTNPVLGYGHSYWGRGNLPIGRVNPESIRIDGDAMSGDLEFDQADEFAREVERKMRDGFLNAVSIGFEVTKWASAEDNYWRGGVAEQWEMHELSVVPVPMDATAVVESGRSLADPALLSTLGDLNHEQFDRLMNRLSALRKVLGPDEPGKPAVEDPVPAVPGINEAAARDLLAAFFMEEHTS